MKSLETRIKSKKLNYIKVKLFFIKCKKKTISFKLKLPNNMIIYLIFYIIILELVDPKIFI